MEYHVVAYYVAPPGSRVHPDFVFQKPSLPPSTPRTTYEDGELTVIIWWPEGRLPASLEPAHVEDIATHVKHLLSLEDSDE